MDKKFLYISSTILIILLAFQYILSKPVYFNKNKEVTYIFTTADNAKVEVKWNIAYKSDIFFKSNKEFAESYSKAVLETFIKRYSADALVQDFSEKEILKTKFEIIQMLYKTAYSELAKLFTDDSDWSYPTITIKFIQVLSKPSEFKGKYFS